MAAPENIKQGKGCSPNNFERKVQLSRGAIDSHAAKEINTQVILCFISRKEMMNIDNNENSKRYASISLGILVSANKKMQ